MLIGITGRSGDGKSTFSRILAQNLLSVETIGVDKLHFSNILSQKDKLIELFGEDIIYDGKLNMKLYMKYPEKVKIIRNLINDSLIKKILSEVNTALEQNKFVIIEWIKLPEVEKLWNMCDIHILVKSTNQDARYSHLLQRHSDPNSNKLEVPYTVTMEQLKVRDYYASDYSRFAYDYVVINNYDECLFAEGKRIAVQILNL